MDGTLELVPDNADPSLVVGMVLSLADGTLLCSPVPEVEPLVLVDVWDAAACAGVLEVASLLFGLGLAHLVPHVRTDVSHITFNVSTILVDTTEGGV